MNKKTSIIAYVRNDWLIDEAQANDLPPACIQISEIKRLVSVLMTMEERELYSSKHWLDKTLYLRDLTKKAIQTHWWEINKIICN
jgi:hypothetical protein